VLVLGPARATPLDVEFDFVTLSSYGTATFPSGNVRLDPICANDMPGGTWWCAGVVDSGRSLTFLIDLLKQRQSGEHQDRTLLDKVPCRKIPVPVDYAGGRSGRVRDRLGHGRGEKYRNFPTWALSRGMIRLSVLGGFGPEIPAEPRRSARAHSAARNPR